eukprot:GEMP01070711.1.p1 GENE.GEMP01070711.1~~GEMP01070711.1.p1  ORF type:complete len:107 (+),score=12.79 GEMP01070711.1:616-936(+)
MHRKDLHYAASLRAKYGRKKYDFLGDFTGNWWAPHPLPAVLDSAKLITPVSSKGGAYFLQNAIPAHVREQLMKESLNALRRRHCKSNKSSISAAQEAKSPKSRCVV